jgi:hypothetical protein
MKKILVTFENHAASLRISDPPDKEIDNILVPAAQLHLGINCFDDGNHAVTNGSLMLGQLLTTGMTKDNEVPSSILYGGIRRGWVGDITGNETRTKVGTHFRSLFVGLELWLTRLGLSINPEFANPDKPRQMCWETRNTIYWFHRGLDNLYVNEWKMLSPEEGRF